VTVWGVVARIERGNPVVVGVELSGSRAAPVGRQVFLHRCESTDTARALMLLANDIEQELAKKPPTVFLVRSMDWFRTPHEKHTRARLQVEGVLLAVARKAVPAVAAYSGKEIGKLCGCTKVEIEAESTRVLSDLDREAAVAGLGALVLDEEG
jgi:ketosteroid isomerase-like protein